MAPAIIVMPRLTKYLIVYISTESFGCECIKILDLARSKCNKRVVSKLLRIQSKAQTAQGVIPCVLSWKVVWCPEFWSGEFSRIKGCHAHAYYDASTMKQDRQLCEEASKLFGMTMVTIYCVVLGCKILIRQC